MAGIKQVVEKLGVVDRVGVWDEVGGLGGGHGLLALLDAGVDELFDPPAHAPLRWALYVVAVAGVCGAGWWMTRIKSKPESL